MGELLELVGLAGLARRYPHQLSGGQQQRVALARALASGPEIVLLDEPFSSLAASLRASVRADVHGALRLAGATAILVTHDQDEALSMADQVAILRGGVIAQINTPATLYKAPRDAELAQFLGAANLVEGTVSGGRVTTALGLLTIAGEAFAAPLIDAMDARPRDLSSLQVLSSSGAALSPKSKVAMVVAGVSSGGNELSASVRRPSNASTSRRAASRISAFVGGSAMGRHLG